MILFLHGFASSSRSSKAAFLTERLRGHGLSLTVPDLNDPDFATLTMTRMLDRVGREIDASGEAAVSVIGSSLGGTVAVLAAERFPARIDSVVLLAPAVMFAKPGHHLLPPERVAEWRRRGRLPFFHYGYGEERPLDVGFYEDSLQYDAFNASFTQPTLIFQGLRDDSVDPRTVEAFARDRRNVTLSLVDDEHSLLESMPRIWHDVEAFLGLVD